MAKSQSLRQPAMSSFSPAIPRQPTEIPTQIASPKAHEKAIKKNEASDRNMRWLVRLSFLRVSMRIELIKSAAATLSAGQSQQACNGQQR
jgi:hypothetical protein